MRFDAVSITDTHIVHWPMRMASGGPLQLPPLPQ